MRYFIGILFWLIYFPLLKILRTLVFWVPGVLKRSRFEWTNLREVGCVSFKKTNEKADFCFEFSSEGEFQQIASLVDDLLSAGKKVELVFFSPSVEKAVILLYQKFPKQIRYLRYPLVTMTPLLSFSYWVSSPNLILVRYDLFPEFLLWALKPGNHLQTIWMTFKKERIRGKSLSVMKSLFLKASKKIVYASKIDQKVGAELGFPGECYDFRMEQIKRRMTLKVQKFQNDFPLYPEILKEMSKFPREKRIIMGNAWPSDLHLLENLPADYFLLIVPHKLSPEILNQMKIGVIVDDSFNAHLPNRIVLNKKGVLCELYQDFGFAYVGGGFEGSIHSVLEPFVSGADHLACGPQNDRSTEIDLVKSAGMISVLNTSAEFLNWLKAQEVPQDKKQLQDFLTQYIPHRKDVLSC